MMNDAGAGPGVVDRDFAVAAKSASLRGSATAARDPPSLRAAARPLGVR
jgi:hypothetical protein